MMKSISKSIGICVGILVAFLFLHLPRGTVSKPSISTSSVSMSSVDLWTARKGFVTRLHPNSFVPSGPAPAPPNQIFRLVRYPASAGKLAAYVTPDPKDGKQHPAVLWAHGGFDGIDSCFWEPATPDNDQSARAFREAGIVLMCPSWRGENDNPGNFELFYGEVDDLMYADKYLANLSYVDPARIYIAGHSTGGTMALLGAETTDKYRAAFSFGGAQDMANVVSNGQGYGNTPYDYRNKQESYLRSPIHFVRFIKKPTFYFEGESSFYINDAQDMQRAAQKANVPFFVFIVKGGDHFNILAPLTGMIADKIKQDTGPQCNITVSEEEVMRAFSVAK